VNEKSTSLIPPGAISFVIKMLFEQKDLNNYSLYEKIENLGADPIYSSDNNFITIGFQSSSDNWENPLNLIINSILNPHFSEKEFVRLKKQRAGEIVQNKGNPMYLAQKGLAKSIYSQDSIDSFTSYGNISSIEDYEFDSIKNIFRKILIFSEDTKISIININNDTKLYKLLDTLKTKNDISNENLDFSNPEKKNYLIYTNTNNPQSAILFGKHLTFSNSTDIISGDLFNEVLGGSFMSRLNVCLRENKGYSYGFGSNIQWNTNPPLLIGGGSVNSSKTKESIDEINNEVRGLFNDNKISNEELNNAKYSLKQEYLNNFETHTSALKMLNWLITAKQSKVFYNQYIKNINKIDSNQIYQYISQNFESLDHFSTIIVGDKSRLKKLQNFDSFNFQLISADEII
jgi:zinc protease